MATFRRPFLAVAASLMMAGCSVFGIRSGTGEVPYTVVDRVGEAVEIREYPARVVADTLVEGRDTEEASRIAFRILFDYISGANAGGAKIAMTAPVATERQQIAMTAPVQTSTGDVGETGQEKGRWFGMRFFLPASFTLERAPKPTDPRVQLILVPAETLAVLRFSGSRRAELVADRQAELLNALDGSSWRVTGAPVAFFYDPPWTVAFLRRNEVAVAVNPPGPASLMPERFQPIN